MIKMANITIYGRNLKNIIYLFIYLFIHNFMTTYTYKYIHVPVDWT